METFSDVMDRLNGARMDGQIIGIHSGGVSPTPARRHVLVVDDDAATREHVANYLTLNDFRVTPAENARQMMEVLQKDPIDLVALEPTLRGEDGHQLASRLRESSKVPIIIVTSRTEEADRVMGLELGADDYVTKPFQLARVACPDSSGHAALPQFRKACPTVVRQCARIASPDGPSTCPCAG